MEIIDNQTYKTFYSTEEEAAENKNPKGVLARLTEKTSSFFQNMRASFAEMELMRPYSSWMHDE